VEILDSLPRPLIYLISKGEMTAADFAAGKIETLETIKMAVENEIPLVQIREKNFLLDYCLNLCEPPRALPKIPEQNCSSTTAPTSRSPHALMVFI
jgi:hypothetical protein